MRRSRFLSVFALALGVVVGSALADGSLSGHVTSPDGGPVGEVRIALIPEGGATGRRAVSTNKKGAFFFGLVPDGRYTLAVEETPLTVHGIHVVVQDTETHKEVLGFKGAPPSKPQVFDVGGNLKVTYDLVLGPADEAPSAAAAKQASALQEVPGLLQAGDYAGALARVETALKAAPDDPTLHYYRAFCFFRMKEYEKAKPEVDRSLELNPAQIGGHWVRGAILSSEGKKAEAVLEFEKELQNQQTDLATRVNSNINIGLLQRDLGNRDAAISAFEKVIALDSSQSEAYSYLAELYLAAGMSDKATAIQARSRELGVEDPKAVFNLGADFWNKKEFAKAEERFRRAAELDPKFALAWKSLGYTLVNMGKTAEATSALNKYLELSPQAEDAKEVRQLLEALGKP